MSARVRRRDFIDAFGNDPMRLPDVVALGTTASDWPKVLAMLNSHDRGAGSRHALTMPADGLSSIALVPRPGVLINLYPGDDITFDFDLSEMGDQAAVDSVCEIARSIGHATKRPVVFIPEGEPISNAVLRFDPSTDAFRLRHPGA